MTPLIAVGEPLVMDVAPILTEITVLLVLVLAAWIVLGRLRSGRGLTRPRTDRNLEVIERVAVGPRRAVIMLRAQGTIRLIGSAESGLTDLGTLPDPPCNTSPSPPEGDPS